MYLTTQKSSCGNNNSTRWNNLSALQLHTCYFAMSPFILLAFFIQNNISHTALDNR